MAIIDSSNKSATILLTTMCNIGVRFAVGSLPCNKQQSLNEKFLIKNLHYTVEIGCHTQAFI